MIRRRSLATHLLGAQVTVILAGAATLITTALLIAPGLFTHHLEMTGEDSAIVQQHAREAFISSFGIAMATGIGLSLIAATIVSWIIVRRVATPVEQLADAAEQLAEGDFEVDVPVTGFSTEIQRLTFSFEQMASRLADSEANRRHLLADLAHELRTPLSTMEAYIDGLEDRVLANDPSTYATMREQIARLRRLSTDLREVALAEEHALGITLEPIDLVELVRTGVAAALPRYEARGVALRSSLPTAAIDANGDWLRLQQVLANLLDNALRHTRSMVHVEVATNDSVATITVTDDGEGLPVDQLEAIFDRFHRVDPSRSRSDGGSGLGLTIARSIINDHGGTLIAESDGPGTGAAFIISLPIG
jgi:signal transduction histidine kinase